MSRTSTAGDDSVSTVRAKKVFIGLAVVVLVISLMVALFYKIESNRGERLWANLLDELRIAGEPTSIEETLALRRPLPDGAETGSNFCDHPLIAAHENFDRSSPPSEKRELLDPASAARFDALRLPTGPDIPELPDFQVEQRVDLQKWSQWLNTRAAPTHKHPGLSDAEFVLTSLGGRSADHQDLVRAARESTRSRFPDRIIVDEDILWIVYTPDPHLEVFRDFCEAASLRASAALALDEPQLARDCLALGFQLMAAIGDSAEYLVKERLPGDRALMGAVWTGLELGAWRDQDLWWLEQLFARIQEGYQEQTILCNRQWLGLHLQANKDPETFRQRALMLLTLISDEPTSMRHKAIPRGWILTNAEVAIRAIWEREIQPIQAENFRLDGIQTYSDFLEEKSTDRRNLFAPYLLNDSQQSMAELGDAITVARLIETACRIERNAHATGNYPESVSGLPVDPLAENRGLIRYQRLANGFQLWGVGQDLINDGGIVIPEFVPAWQSHHIRSRDPERGDIVLTINRDRDNKPASQPE